ncbi:TIGR03084 family protein [bacterium]|nr:TIGR03084 family protein [bacterium]
MEAICRDLADEYQELDDTVSKLSEAEWNQTTPFFGWSIKDEISHIAFFDSTAYLATQNREEFQKGFEDFLTKMKPGDSMYGLINDAGRKKPVDLVLKEWREQRDGLVKALSILDPKARLPWYGPDMSAKSFATARLMETWAHGQDVYDTLKIRRKLTDRIKHIAHLGVTTYGWSFMVRQQQVPAPHMRVELNSPSGELWVWGPEEAENSVKGDAGEFCQVVTQRRNVADTNLNMTGDAAKQWMQIAQAFAGMAEDPPKPGQRVVDYN